MSKRSASGARLRAGCSAVTRKTAPSREPSIRPQHSLGYAAAAWSRICPASAAGSSRIGFAIGEARLDLSYQMTVLGIEQIDLFARGIANPEDQSPGLA